MKRALVISLICVLGLAFTGLAASLSGSWDTDITIDPTNADFGAALGLTSVLTVIYTVGDWAFTSVTDLDDTGWTDQDFSVAGVLGAFTITSALDFIPDSASFGSWNVTSGVSIAGVSFTVVFDLEPQNTQLVLGAIGVAGDVGVGVSVTFGDLDGDDGCDLDWAGVVISLDFPFCCADITSVISFDCTGFESIVFSAGGIAIPNLPWVTIDAELTFTMLAKSLKLTPTFDFGTFTCFTLDVGVDYVGGDMAGILSLDSFEISGISLSCDIGGVTFTGASTLKAIGVDGVTALFGPVGNQIYWEYYKIATTDDACCGPFNFDLTIYFLEGGAKLFDVALVDANMSLQVASQFVFNMGLEVNVQTKLFTEWTIGFLVTW